MLFMIRFAFISILSFLFPVLLMAQAGDKNISEEALVNNADVVFYGGFEDSFNDQNWKTSWGIPWNNRADKARVLEGSFNGSSYLRVNYPKGGVGPGETGVQFPIVLQDAGAVDGGHFKELYLRYYVNFEEGFDFNKGGKLPGLMGGGDSWGRSGGNQPDGTNGWTLRFMWRSEGELVVYAYVPKSANGKWGAEVWGQDISTGVKAIPGQWHCIEEYVNVGTPGKDDGQLKVWIDDEQKIDIDDMRFWDVENNFGLIGGLYFSTFHGGNTDDWAPRDHSAARFDEIVLSKSRVGIYDDKTSFHQHNLELQQLKAVQLNDSQLKIKYYTKEPTSMQAELIALDGTTISTTKWMETGQGSLSRNLSIDKLQPGAYILRLQTGTAQKSVKLSITD